MELDAEVYNQAPGRAYPLGGVDGGGGGLGRRRGYIRRNSEGEM